ncbi:MAG: MBL fold metallo-hydrolase, partial [Hyphomonadaceae bacterium]
MTDTLRVTMLGSGSSSGVPRIDGDWGVCDPNEPRNRRMRCGLLVQRWRGPAGDPAEATTVLIDTSPDLRAQMLAADVKRLDGVIYSHDHADQTHGIDDLRGFVITQRRRVRVWMDEATRATLMHRFQYCFEARGGYPAILDHAGDVGAGEVIIVNGPGGEIAALPIAQNHGYVVSYGFRIGDVGYSNDVVGLDDAAFAALAGLEVWIVDALRLKPHPTHSHLE